MSEDEHAEAKAQMGIVIMLGSLLVLGCLFI